MSDTIHPYIASAIRSIKNKSKPNLFFYFRTQEELEENSYCFSLASVADRMLSCSMLTYLRLFLILRYLMSLTTPYQVLKVST